jgi:hypothetical protein
MKPSKLHLNCSMAKATAYPSHESFQTRLLFSSGITPGLVALPLSSKHLLIVRVPQAQKIISLIPSSAPNLY